MDEEKIETYSPPTDEVKPLDTETMRDGFEDVMEKDGIINTKLNEKVIIKRIAKDLYKNATSGMRELYNNSVRACRIAVKQEGLEKPLIRVTMNENQRTLIIEDNGLGISKARFKKVLLELGTSDNLTGDEVGQFGMGFASYTTLSSVVIIDTKCRNGDQYKMVAKDGMSFQPVGDTTLKEYGTRMEMTCYSEVDFNDLVQKLEDIVRYSGIPTILELNEFQYYPNRFRRGANAMEQTSFDESVDKYRESRNVDIVEIETEDFKLIALASGKYINSNSRHVHLLNTPILSEINTPFNWWVLNIKDERKFMPMPDRDRMREIADRKLSSLIDKELKKYFADLDIDTYQKFLDSPRKNEFLWLTNNQDYVPAVMSVVVEKLEECRVRDVIYDSKTFHDGTLVEKLSNNNDVVYQGYKNREFTKKIREFKPLAKLITVKKSKKHNWKKDVEFMEEFGIPTGKQILIDNKVKIPKSDKAEFELIGHTHLEYYEHEVVALDDIDENFIRVDSIPINDFLRYVRKFKNPYTFVRNAVELDEYDCRDYSDWLKNDIPYIVCATSKGAMTIKEIADGKKEYIFCEDFEPEFAYFFKEDKRIVIYGTDQMLAMLFYLNPECESDSSPWTTPANEVKSMDFEDFVSEKYDVNLNSDYDKKFFCINMHKIHPSLHQLFGNLLRNVPYRYGEDDKEGMFEDYLATVLKYEPIEDDEIARLRFYYGEHAKMADPDSNIAETFERLVRDCRAKIMNNEYLLGRLVKEVLMPEVFGHVEFRSLKKEQLSYQDCYEVNLATHDTEFHFRDDMRVFGFELMFRGCKMKINKGYCSVKVLVNISL